MIFILFWQLPRLGNIWLHGPFPGQLRRVTAPLLEAEAPGMHNISYMYTGTYCTKLRRTAVPLRTGAQPQPVASLETPTVPDALLNPPFYLRGATRRPNDPWSLQTVELEAAVYGCKCQQDVYCCCFCVC